MSDKVKDEVKVVVKDVEQEVSTISKSTWLKIGGVAGVVIGSVCLFLAGAGVSAVTDVVGGVFVLAGLIAVLLK